jgi:heptosyltransferase II
MITNKPKNASEQQHVLIFKLGYTETLDQDVGGIVSLGDVLRTTVVLHLFPPEKYNVTWVVDPKAAPLLRGNPFISRVISVNAFTPHQLMSEWYDIVINFEKDPGVCAVADRIPAWKRFGFRYDPSSGNAVSHEHSDIAVSMSGNNTYKKSIAKSWSEILYQMLNEVYEKQPYILGHQPQSREIHDVGLNHLVGKKYPMKKWPEQNWNKLHDQLSTQHQVSWQQGENSLDSYIDWINSCRIIVTNDSLGLHLALALGKKVVALFGPTISTEIDSGPNIIKITPEVSWNCIPCLESRCHQNEICMTQISLETVISAIQKFLP